RCNVTHDCRDPKLLTSYYPRGHKELLGPFHIFGVNDTVQWFEEKGVPLYIQDDGCMFPLSNDSGSIIHCFLEQAKKYNITIVKNVKVKDFTYHRDDSPRFELVTDDSNYTANAIMMATGSSPFMWNALARHGYNIVPPVPSLFTFNLPNHPICKLMGLVVNDVQVTIQDSKIVTTGPILVTHWGLSAPAVLKASAWGATLLNERNYNFNVMVDWIPTVSQDQILHLRDDMAKKKVISNQLFGLPARLWQFLMSEALTTEEKNWASLTKNEMSMIIRQLKKCVFPVKGKTTFKEEFVTAGGIALHQINFKSFESKLHPGLFMAGEVLNIDAVTGGFNFQAAWTGGYIAGSKMAEI
ncbi:MAG: aminoacetone oxidase family FAD-binding enzyme, partial [Saprospiraceae bacterium]